jgi:hypothetical protein
MAATSSSGARRVDVDAYPRERQSLRRSKSSGESMPNLRRLRSVSSCLDLDLTTCLYRRLQEIALGGFDIDVAEIRRESGQQTLDIPAGTIPVLLERTDSPGVAALSS